jgi:DNA repair exonuclease SbcCD nuclease subunit
VVQVAPIESAVVVTDVHTREDSIDIVSGEVFPGIMALCKAECIKHVFCLGDFWHLRYRVPVALLNTIRERLYELRAAGIYVTFLPGNHDQVDVQGRNAVSVFGDIEGITVYDNPTWTPHGLWLPYRTTLDEMTTAIAMPRPKGYMPIAWMHYGVHGALRNNHIRDVEGVKPHLFGDFEHVYCGHYHKRQQLGPGGNIWYVGSPYQTRADEAGDPKGLAVWRAGHDLKFHDYTWGMRYVKAHVTDVGSIKALAAQHPIGMHDYRLTVAAGVDLAEVSKSLESQGISRYTLTPEVEAAQVRLEVKEGESLEEYAKAYMELKMDTKDDAMWTTFRRITEGKHDCKRDL